MKPKKLIISRKGFDSESGGCPSPIFPDGTIYSLPIPGNEDEEPIHYDDLEHDNVNIGEVVEGLTRRRYTSDYLAGVDPDIRPDALLRHDGWRALFGQAKASQTHLENQGVGVGDVFLFFGLFQQVEIAPTGWRFVRGAPKLHLLWGWLQIEQILKVDQIRNDEHFSWATYHCHFSWEGDPSNTLYMASNQLDLGDGLKVTGAGTFPRLDERLVLTKPGGSASQWRLPRWFYPDSGKTPLTYHPDPKRWSQDNNYAYLNSVGRGQEFVLDLEQYPEALGWLSGLFNDLGRG